MPRHAIFLLTPVIFLSAAGIPLAAETQDGNATANPFGRVYPPRIYNTVRLSGPAPAIDGRLDDEAWRQGEWAGDFKQQIPTEGAVPTAPTELKILYDDRSIYVAIRAHDDMTRIHRYPSRRDEMQGDIVGVCFDSDFDKRSGFEFDLTAAGGKIDLVLMNDDLDTSWDAVWHGKTAFEEKAWTAEFEIPLSQLRYGPQDEQVWGMHAWRWIDRNQEEAQWQLIPRNSTGRMYNLGELHGISGLKRFRRVEMLPHIVGELSSNAREPRDPYRSGGTPLGSAGLDAKVGLATDFTLDATINPDFGQVEADPSVMNLTAFETFYEEKRPFFLEGKDILSFPVEGDRLFYSRRIGQAPRYAPDLRDDEFIKKPDSTTILTAAKITGKTRDGLSLGLLQSITGRETALISYQGTERRQPVEPAANFVVGRAHKDWNKGNTALGAMLTSTHRFVHDSLVETLPGDALTAGLDFTRHFRNRTYSIEIKAIASRVSGSSQAMRDLQRNAAHYYQRPDASHLDLDENATSLWGHGGSLSVSRAGASKWSFSHSLSWKSPGLDINDIGFMSRADLIDNEAYIGYKQTEPRGPFREYSVELGREDTWDFGGLHHEGMTSFNASGGFKNKWGGSMSALWVETSVSTRLLRGGPAVRKSPFLCSSVSGHTDNSRKAAFSLNLHRHVFAEGGSDLVDVYPSLTLRLSNAFSISTELQYSYNRDDLQYVSTVESDAGARYILGRIRQNTYGATLRLNLQLTPDLSIQYYGSPFVSVGRYSDFKRVAAPLAARYEDRFHRIRPSEQTFDAGNDAYEVREIEAESGGSYSFGNPDFSFRQFRSNLVARWEFKPGSALYVVWSQGRTSEGDSWVGSLGDNFDALFRARADNVFLAKLSYWFSL